MGHSVRKHLRLDVDAYDATIRRFIPGYDQMIDAAVTAVVSESPARVVDLGAGTGTLSAAVLDRSPGTGVELIDIDDEMLARARTRLAEFGRQPRFVLRSFDDPLTPCDAVMASLSLHHVPTLAAKTALFARIHACLPSGGVFVNADVTMPSEEPQRAAAYDAWAAHLVANGCERADAFGHFEAWSTEDTYFPLEAELGALGEVGFEASCVWKHGVSTVTVGRRP